MKVTTFAGNFGKSGHNDGPLRDSSFNRPKGICLDKNGNIFVADSGNNCVRRIECGKVKTITGNINPRTNMIRYYDLFHPTSMIYDDEDDILYVYDSHKGRIRAIYSGGIITIAIGFKGNTHLALDEKKDILIAHSLSNSILKLGEAGQVREIFDPIRIPMVIKIDSNGKIYVSTLDGKIVHWNGCWEPLWDNTGVILDFVIDRSNGIWILDSHCIRRINRNIIEVYMENDNPSAHNSLNSIAMFKNALYVCDSGSNVIKKVDIPTLWNRGSLSLMFKNIVNHKFFSAFLRRQIKAIVMISSKYTILKSVPKDILYVIFQLLACDETSL